MLCGVTSLMHYGDHAERSRGDVVYPAMVPGAGKHEVPVVVLRSESS